MKKKKPIIVSLFILTILLLIIISKSLIVTILMTLFIISSSVMFYSNEISYAIKKRAIKKAAFDSIKEDVNFYREIIQEYSIGELSFIDGYDINYPRDIVAILLKLQSNKVIIIDENGIKQNENYNYKLKESEKYILDSINDGKVILPNDIVLTEIITEEIKKDRLIKNNKSGESKTFFSVVIAVICYLVLFFLFTSETTKYILTISFFTIFIAVVLCIALSNNKYSWRLTEEGKKIFIKLMGLKKYLSEFSIIDKKEIEELILWDDYLIYSVIFNINKDIIKKISNYIIVQERLEE